jgi:tripartite-type tricarboxylate transporter receptor subunit TctC
LRDLAGMIGGGTWEGAPMFDMRRMAGSGIGAPKGTPAEIVEKLNKEINAAISDPDMKARLADLGGIVLMAQSGPKSTSAFLPLLEE